VSDPDHIERLRKGVARWNKWYTESGQKLIGANLSGAVISLGDFGNLENIDLENADLSGAQVVNGLFTGANFRRAKLAGARFIGSVLSKANLQEVYARKAYFAGSVLDGADLLRGQFSRTNLCQASLDDVRCYETSFMEADVVDSSLRRADLYRSDLRLTNFTRSDLTEANLQEIAMYLTDFTDANLTSARLDHSSIVNVTMRGAVLKDCSVFGTSTWDVDLEGAVQTNLRIEPREWYGEEPFEPIYVDDLEMAQLIYLMLRNPKIRNIIDTISSKAVLILGRFTQERKAVLDGVRARLRQLGFVPIVFDFERPTRLDFTETVRTLAGLSRFIIADITNPRSSPLELEATMPDYMIPFVPIIHEDEEPFAMFRDLKQKYGNWVLDVLRYDSADNLVKVLDRAVVRPALEKGQELLLKKAEDIRSRHVMDYMGPEGKNLFK